MHLHTFYAEDVKTEVMDQVIGLVDQTWPDSIPHDKTQTQRRGDFLKRNKGKQCHIIFDNEKVVGYAESFQRTVRANTKAIKLLGIGVVCVSTDYRGQGLGEDLIRVCFGRVNHGEFPVCLFQTGVPEFYSKYNCKEVSNQFVDSTNTENPTQNPFWDPHVMIYPAHYDWPTETIDLHGRGY